MKDTWICKREAISSIMSRYLSGHPLQQIISVQFLRELGLVLCLHECAGKNSSRLIPFSGVLPTCSNCIPNYNVTKTSRTIKKFAAKQIHNTQWKERLALKMAIKNI